MTLSWISLHLVEIGIHYFLILLLKRYNTAYVLRTPKREKDRKKIQKYLHQREQMRFKKPICLWRPYKHYT